MIDTSENEVKIKRGKSRLEAIRKEGEENGRGSISSRGYATPGAGSDHETTGGSARVAGGDQEGERGVEEGSRFSQGSRQGIRQVEPENEYPASGPREDSRRYEAGLAPIIQPAKETPEEKAERERELARQRKQRQRDREKALETGVLERNILESERESVTGRDRVTPPRFTLKIPFSKKSHDDNKNVTEKVKLFTIKEASEELEKMTTIYIRGSGLLDDLLEVVVKDHEPVQIWQLDEEEAAMLAEMHLERAKVDEGAARSARKLLEIYDRLYIWLLIGPRVKATASHIKAHKGFSFK